MKFGLLGWHHDKDKIFPQSCLETKEVYQLTIKKTEWCQASFLMDLLFVILSAWREEY
jgi:hypothetical protein